jgi:hypothetical protein
MTQRRGLAGTVSILFEVQKTEFSSNKRQFWEFQVDQSQPQQGFCIKKSEVGSTREWMYSVLLKMSSEYIVSLQAHINKLQTTINHQQIVIGGLHHRLQLSHHYSIASQSHIRSAFNILAKRMFKQLHYRNLPPARPFLTESIQWSPDFASVLFNLPYGELQQPLLHFRPNSNRIIRIIKSLSELRLLFPQHLRKDFISGCYSKLDLPLFLIWSKSTNCLSIRFSYTATGKIRNIILH